MSVIYNFKQVSFLFCIFEIKDMQNNYESLKKSRSSFNYQLGQKFGGLTYTGLTYTKKILGNWKRFIEAVCECGQVKIYSFSSVASGDTKSCGCYRKKVTRRTKTTHGLSKHSLFQVHSKMISRCYNHKDPSFSNYGSRNIEVWKDWKDSFVDFYEWSIENGYKEGLSLDRVNNDGNYAPFNCRWATVAEQNRNRRNNRIFTAFGDTKCLWDWGNDKRCVVGVWALRSRMDSGKWTDNFEGALTTKEDRKLSGRTKKNNKYLTAFGETKCMSEWVEDERCVVGGDRLRDRIAEGWEHLAAITTVNIDKKDIFITAFGESKNMTEWLKDERCVVKRDALRDRFRKGWAHEDCITVPSKTRPI